MQLNNTTPHDTSVSYQFFNDGVATMYLRQEHNDDWCKLIKSTVDSVDDPLDDKLDSKLWRLSKKDTIYHRTLMQMVIGHYSDLISRIETDLNAHVEVYDVNIHTGLHEDVFEYHTDFYRSDCDGAVLLYPSNWNSFNGGSLIVTNTATRVETDVHIDKHVAIILNNMNPYIMHYVTPIRDQSTMARYKITLLFHITTRTT